METISQLEAWWAYASRCAQAPSHAPACDSFWNAVATLAVVVFAAIVLYVVRRMVGNFLAVRAENARAAERERVADEATMAQFRPDTDTLFAVSSEENVEQRIKQALEERKAEEWGRPGASRRPAGSE